MERFNKTMFEIDRPNPPKEFWQARQIAGCHLQECFKKFSQENWHEGFFWVKAEPTYPSFDNLTFAYKNQIFSVLIDFVEITKKVLGKTTMRSLLPENVITRFLKATEENNLVPCLFPVDANILQPITSTSWNLLHAKTKEWIKPENMATDERIPMSKWEINNFVIQIVRDHLTQQGNKILSFCDLVEIEPQIWFENKKGEQCWVLAKFVEKPEDNDYHKWLGLEKCNKKLLDFDGFFAGVELRNATDFGDILYRGEGAHIKFKGLSLIHFYD